MFITEKQSGGSGIVLHGILKYIYCKYNIIQCENKKYPILSWSLDLWFLLFYVQSNKENIPYSYS